MTRGSNGLRGADLQILALNLAMQRYGCTGTEGERL